MANVLWNLLQNRRYKVLRYCCLTILPRFRFKNEGFCFVFKKAMFFLSGCKAHLKCSQSSSYWVLSLSCVSSACRISQPYMVAVVPVSATSCYTNSWSVSLLWPSFPYSFHILAISSVAWKPLHFASVSLVPPYQSKTLQIEKITLKF